MAWDSTRPVPWQRLLREWFVYVAVMAVVFTIFFRDSGDLVGIFAGLLVSGPLYLGFGFVLAKLGYQRSTWKELRSQSGRPKVGADAPPATGPKPKPAPTRRTGAPSGRPGTRSPRR